MRSETHVFDTPNGATTAYVALPDTSGVEQIVILIHEWWGLNEHVKDIAGRYAGAGFICVAPDLYRGTITKDKDEAARLMHELALDDGIATIEAAITSLREKFGYSHVGITGYCMGGTFALRAACLVEGLKAAAPFYGDIAEEDVLKKLRIPTVFICGAQDKWISPAKVAELQAAADKYELPVETISYDADHAFFNDTRPEVYNPEAAADAWARVTDLFRNELV